MKINEPSVSTVEEPARKRGRPRSFDREAAREKALQLFWEHGYEGTSINDLTAAMGITPPSLYTAFGSKEALYAEVLDLYRSSFGAYFPSALTEEKTVYDGIRRLLRGAAETFTAGPGGCMISTAVLSCASEVKGVADSLAAMRSGSLDMIENYIRKGIGTGELPETTDVRQLARFYGTIIQGMSVQARDGASVEELTGIAETAMRAWPVQAPD
ncbi:MULTISPECIES: TetR/AcrR family transcriptional regulator [unclassified Phyllobacterium]|uniref:TetR/AcrR family transcriptional regulator n=1 Tax=unclassified Phyllobacterium TaxID=2638441 RepID=UPI0031FC9D82|nr:TetR/AcrR family transcriptional regulator [Phyllobacterium sp.]